MLLSLVCTVAVAAWVAPPTIVLASDAAPEAEFESAQALLEGLERADRGIETLTADIQYDKHFLLQGDTHRRRGQLLFQSRRDGSGGPPKRAFEIDFNSLRIGGRLEEDPETWIFDGRWLVEMHPEQKQFIKREIAGEGDRADPLAIGEGPMPIPIGQKADEVLRRYDARLAPIEEPFTPDEQDLAQFVSDTWQLVLTPRPGSGEDDKYKEIRIWYSKSGERRLLPRMARTLSRAGDISYVQLINIETNVELPARAFDVTPPPASEHWQVQIEPLPAPGAGK